ncbi:hypothetical protein [Peterkaempfera griseoplana]|uniref:hypothetical protein n=1 Tax=Peterkaempfera griseoplana TaxID=66896 RepID=UPI0006E1288D|nr:hypothetical protein [Peterkaempfera griseoplana]
MAAGRRQRLDGPLLGPRADRRYDLCAATHDDTNSGIGVDFGGDDLLHLAVGRVLHEPEDSLATVTLSRFRAHVCDSLR